MRNVVVVALWLALPLASAGAIGAGKAADKPAVVVERVETEGTLKELFDEMWAKLRSYGPKLTTGEVAAARTTQVAGVRGAESTGTQLKPYWKDDRTGDPAYVQEVNAFNRAQAAAEGGDAARAIRGFEDFLKSYPNSALRPNAEFALGLAYGASGQKAKSQATLAGFIREYPSHPLVGDAKHLSEALQKP